MSVLINMEMPTSCDVCPLIAEADDYHVCYINEQFIPWEWIDEHSAEQRHPRPSWCPLVPVPPHGRLIEKNAVFELIRSFPNVDRQLPVEFMKALYELPTILEA